MFIWHPKPNFWYLWIAGYWKFQTRNKDNFDLNTLPTIKYRSYICHLHVCNQNEGNSPKYYPKWWVQCPREISLNMYGNILPNFQSEGYINDILNRKIKRYHAVCLFSNLGTRFPRVWSVLAWDIPPTQLCWGSHEESLPYKQKRRVSAYYFR
jgi:hypothetical protein